MMALVPLHKHCAFLCSGGIVNNLTGILRELCSVFIPQGSYLLVYQATRDYVRVEDRIFHSIQLHKKRCWMQLM